MQSASGWMKSASEIRPNETGDEAYLLTASPENGIEIVGTDPAGVFYGVQTLRALLPLDAYQNPHGRN